MLFRSRQEAGRILAGRLSGYKNRPGLIVLALPRGGVPVAYEVAIELRALLDVFLVRKLGVPGNEELAMGAIATGGHRILNDLVIEQLDIPAEVIEAVAAREESELKRREQIYRQGRPPLRIAGRTVILIDDGLATGSTMRVASEALIIQNAAYIVVAVPVAAASVYEDFRGKVDEIVCAYTPEPFYGVGQWYQDFSQMTDQEVCSLLQQATQNVGEEAIR